MKNFTVAVISRIYSGELPYIKAFIHHYITIGVDNIYFVITNLAEEPYLREYLRGSNVKFLNSPLAPDQNITMDSMSILIEQIKDTYLLHVDIDEFLDVKSIKDTIEEEKAEKIHFKWAITVFDNINDTTKGVTGMARKNKPYKTICKTDSIASFTSNGHDFDTNKPVKDVVSKYNLIHYWGRSFNDILIKIIYGNGLKNIKTSSSNDLLKKLEDPSIHSIPVRLKMMALLSRLEKTIPLYNNYITNKIEITKEDELVYSVISTEQQKQIYERYLEFRKAFDYEKIKELYYKEGLLGPIDWVNA